MSDPMQPQPTVDADNARPVTKRFRKRFDTVRLSPEEAERQGRIARVAWERLDGRDAAVAFLNTHDDALDGRPIDLAMASDEGLARVEQALAARAAGGSDEVARR